MHCFLPLWRPEYGVARSAWRKLSGLERSRLIQAWRDTCNANALANLLASSEEDIQLYQLNRLPFPPDYKSELLDPLGIELHSFEL